MSIVGVTFGLADLALVLVVTFLAVGTAYLPSPRAKSICFSIPLPFSAALISSGQSVDATNAIGFLAIWAFVWIAWYLYAKKVWNILLAELAALLFYCSVSYVVPFYVGHDGLTESICFWSAWGLMIPVSLVMIVLLPAKLESRHKSPLPVLIKTLLIFMMVLFVVLAKSHMRGFITSFRYVTIFAVYESRHSLYTVARRCHPSSYHSCLSCFSVAICPHMSALPEPWSPVGFALYRCLSSWTAFTHAWTMPYFNRSQREKVRNSGNPKMSAK